MEGMEFVVTGFYGGSGLLWNGLVTIKGVGLLLWGWRITVVGGGGRGCQGDWVTVLEAGWMWWDEITMEGGGVFVGNLSHFP